MKTDMNITVLNQHIKILKDAALALQSTGSEIPAIERNAVRILAGIKMLELNVSDLYES